MFNFIAFILHFMGSDNKFQVIFLKKPLCHICTKRKTYASFAWTSPKLRLRVTP
uniref:Serine/threonine-protein phosphatase 5 n=1 Tax=Arundo donax TaxID=35708 RepID=A0A0A9CY54_ARUDO